MIAFKAHLGVLLILLVICNFTEAVAGSDNPRDTDFPAASGGAFILFCVLELIAWIVYFCFVL
jgi:hypothetical protein